MKIIIATLFAIILSNGMAIMAATNLLNQQNNFFGQVDCTTQKPIDSKFGSLINFMNSIVQPDLISFLNQVKCTTTTTKKTTTTPATTTIFKKISTTTTPKNTSTSSTSTTTKKTTTTTTTPTTTTSKKTTTTTTPTTTTTTPTITTTTTTPTTTTTTPTTTTTTPTTTTTTPTTTTTTSTTTTSLCPTSPVVFDYWAGKCYHYASDPIDIRGAQIACSQLKSALIIVNNDNQVYVNRTVTSGAIWVGGTYIGGTSISWSDGTLDNVLDWCEGFPVSSAFNVFRTNVCYKNTASNEIYGYICERGTLV